MKKQQTRPVQAWALRVHVRWLVACGLILFAAAQADTATIPVQSTGDGVANSANCPGASCRLRDAIAAANNGDTIGFLVTGTITLTTGQLVVDKSITISGPGANVLAVDANAASRVFYINPAKTVAISGLTITNGFADFGAGVLNDRANLTVSECNISGNNAFSEGGGISNAISDTAPGSTTLTIKNSTLSGNSANSVAGAIVESQHWWRRDAHH